MNNQDSFLEDTLGEEEENNKLLNMGCIDYGEGCCEWAEVVKRHTDVRNFEEDAEEQHGWKTVQKDKLSKIPPLNGVTKGDEETFGAVVTHQIPTYGVETIGCLAVH